MEFSISPSELSESLDRALTDDRITIIIKQLTHDLLLQGQNGSLNSEAGGFLDDISFPIFRYGNLNLTYKEYELPSKESKTPTFKLINFIVERSCPFIGVTNIKKMVDFITSPSKDSKKSNINNFFSELLAIAENPNNIG